MTNSLAQTAEFFVTIFAELAVLFIIVSVLIGLMNEYVPASFFQRMLGGRYGLGNFLGVVLGGVTPFCSCSTVPVTAGLLQAGAPFGATMSFLIASPLIDPIILAPFLVLFGWKATVIYTIMCVVLSMVLGMLAERLGLAAQVKQIRLVGGTGSQEGLDKSFGARLGRSLRMGIDGFREVFPHMLVGVAIGSAIYGLVPTEWIASVAGPDDPLAIPIAALIGIPLYVRAEAMIPIGAALASKGMSLGAVVALIISGAGCSLPEITLLSSLFKPRLVAAFVTIVLMVAVLSGLAFTVFYA